MTGVSTLPDPPDGPLAAPRGAQQTASASPLASAFATAEPWLRDLGLYLATRRDQLEPLECRQLALLPTSTPPAPWPEVKGVVERGLGRRLDDLFQAFDREPFASRPLFQWHHARLAGGERVTVKVVRPAAAAAAGRPPRLPNALRAVLEAALARPRELGAVLDDFDRLRRARLDLEAEAAALDEIADDERAPWFSSPARPFDGSCGPGVLTLARMEGETAGALPGPPAEAPGGERPTVDRGRLARRLWRLWLRLVTARGLLAIEPSGDNLLLLEGGRLTIAGGAFARPSADSRRRIGAYLHAVAAGEPRLAGRLLLELLERRPRAAEQRLRHRVRHTAVLRDAGWEPDGDPVARELFAHWRHAAELGFKPQRAMLRFLQGAATLAEQTRRLAPGHPALAEALTDLRLRELLGEWGRLGSSGAWRYGLEQQATVWLELPRKLDRVLTRVAEPATRPTGSAEKRDSRAAGRRSGSWPIAVALWLALASAAALGHASAAATAGWPERLAAVALLGVGGLFLRTTWRRR